VLATVANPPGNIDYAESDFQAIMQEEFANHGIRELIRYEPQFRMLKRRLNWTHVESYYVYGVCQRHYSEILSDKAVVVQISDPKYMAPSCDE
jgi:hypothetical protein